MQLYNSEYLDKSADPTFPAKLESYNLLNLKESEKILDIGCGTGFDAIRMAKLKAGGGKVYGLDLDPKFIAIAEEAKEKSQIDNVEFFVGKAEELPFKDNELDAVRVERVFQHLAEPGKVWDEIKRVLKPGGILVVVETDWKGLSFYSPAFEVSDSLVNFLVHKRLNNGMASRNLISEMVDYGFQETTLEVVPIQIPNYALADMFIKIGGLAMLAIENQVVSQKQFEEWKSSFETVEKSKTPIGLLNMFVTKAIL
jgi:ubiquinone/menaquinone biosynthesis C-methylase UbiE